MLKSILLVLIMFSSVFAEENINGLFGLKLNHNYLESGTNVVRLINKEEETVSFFKQEVPEPLFFFFELENIKNTEYFLKTFRNKTIFISGSFSSGDVSQEKINHMFIKITLLKQLLEKKYNIPASDFLYLKNDKSIPAFPSSLSTLNGNGLFQTDNKFTIYFFKNNVKYNIDFSYTKDLMTFKISVENQFDKEEIEKLVKHKVINAL